MPAHISHTEQVRQALQRFQDYYTRRDPALLEAFLELLADDDLEVIGTGGMHPGEGEWHLGKASARAIFLGDWQSWGNVCLDVAGARIRVNGNTAWLACAGTVEMTIPTEQGLVDYLTHVRQYLDSSQACAEEKLLSILRGGSNTLYELRRGERFIWSLRFTGVLALQDETWKFHQMQFSFPTLYFPDARCLDS